MVGVPANARRCRLCGARWTEHPDRVCHRCRRRNPGAVDRWVVAAYEKPLFRPGTVRRALLGADRGQDRQLALPLRPGTGGPWWKRRISGRLQE